jgi:hypothetical protein
MPTAPGSGYYSPGEGAAGQAKRLKARSKSGYKGVRANGKRWQAQVYYDSEQHHIGTYDTKPEAALAYDAAARAVKGTNAVCNFDSLEAAQEAAVTARWKFLHHTPNAQDQSFEWWRNSC